MKNDVKKTVYDKLVAKVNNVDTNGSVLKTNYGTEKKSQKIKLLLHKLNAKTTEIEGNIASISGLATNAALTEVENKLPNVSNLVKKKEYDTKTNEIEKKLTDHDHDKYIITAEFNKLSAEVFDARLKQAGLVTKTDVDDKLKNLNQKLNSNKTKYLLV